MFTSELWQQSGVSTFSIDQSIRFNKADSAYLTKTFGSSASNRRTHTYSFWVKLGANAAGANANGGCFFLSTNDSGSNAGDYLHLNGSLELRYWSNNSSAETFKTNQVFRDYSAWYHIVLVNDRDNSVGSEAVRLYVNGQRVTSFSVDNISGRKSQDTMVNGSSYFWQIQRFTSGDVNGDCYMADIVFIDGTALEPSSFGEFKEDSDIWVPKDVSGLTFGTNGFWIDGRDSGDLGDDESGRGNDYTASGLASDDQQPDSPTDNHAVFNPLDVAHNGYTAFSEGNLAITYSGSSARELARSSITIPASTDGFFETKMTTTLGSGVDFAIGIEDGSALQDASNTTYTNAYVIREDGTFSTKGSSSTTSYGVSFTNNDVIGVWRKANGDLVFYKNGTAMNSGTPAVTGVTGEMHFVAGGFNGGAGIGRFASGQWTNKPTGVTDSMALNTSNLGS